MKILYVQNKDNYDNSVFSAVNIKNSVLKKLVNKFDYKTTTLKNHYHIDYEIHIVLYGKQSYEIDGEKYEVSENEFVIIPPGVNHRMLYASENMVKYSITFNCDSISGNLMYKSFAPQTVRENIEFICEEFSKKLTYSQLLIENRFFEMLVLLLRTAGYSEEINDTVIHQGNVRTGIAKKFIEDNLEKNLTVEDVANYCHICKRQLTRNFIESEGISPARYITDEKMKKISEYVKYSELSVKQISEKFSYSSDCYFNNAFKKYFGMTPYTYRKMFRQ